MLLVSSPGVMSTTAVITPDRMRSSIVAPTPTAWNVPQSQPLLSKNLVMWSWVGVVVP